LTAVLTCRDQPLSSAPLHAQHGPRCVIHEPKVLQARNVRNQNGCFRADSNDFIWYKARAAELWGREPAISDSDERFCGAHTLYHPDGSHMAHCDTPVALALSTGPRCMNRRSFIGRPDGSRVPVSARIDPIRNPKDGQIIGVVNFFNDLTERKCQEAEREHLFHEAETRSEQLQEAREELETKVEQRTIAVRRLVLFQVCVSWSSNRAPVQSEKSTVAYQCEIGVDSPPKAYLTPRSSPERSVKRRHLCVSECFWQMTQR
jgi:hypothetical protein